jgi:CubicO group peptidase (beta-lactamase class C family)
MRQWLLKGAAFVAIAFAQGLACAQGIPAARPEAVGLSSARLDKLKSYFQTEVDQGRIPGVVLMVMRDGKLAYSQVVGFQDKDASKPMKMDSIFRIYSMTKPLVTVAAMTLVEDGKIQLTDPVSKYLPEFAKMNVSTKLTEGASGEVHYLTTPAVTPITVHDLMRHTSGLAYAEITKNPSIKKAYIDGGLFVENGTDYDSRNVTPAQEVTVLSKAPLSTQPSTNWEYGMSVDVLGRVIEAASGMRLSAYLDQRVFKPLKMTDTGFQVPAAQVSRIAQPLAIDPATGTPNKVLDVTIAPLNDSGGAGGVSTASDYLRFTDMLLHGGELDGQRILSPTTIRLMTSDSLGDRTTVPLSPGELLMGVQGYTFGLGFMVRKGPGLAGVPGSEGEFMWAGAAGTFFWVDPKEKLAVVAMMQVPGPLRPGYRRALKQLVYAAIVEEGGRR